MDSAPKIEQASAAEIIERFWREMARPGDDRDKVADRIRKALSYGLKTGRIRRIRAVSGLRGQVFDLQEAVAALRGRRANARGPSLIPLETLEVVQASIKIADSAEGAIIPGSLDRCQRALRDAYERIRMLEAEAAAMQARLKQVEPDAQKWNDFTTRSGGRGKWD